MAIIPFAALLTSLEYAIAKMRDRAERIITYAQNSDLNRASFEAGDLALSVYHASAVLRDLYWYGYIGEKFFEPWYDELIKRW